MDFQAFYTKWAEEELLTHEKERLTIAQWKATAMLEVLPSTFTASSLIEIGCAEGHILHQFSQKFSTKKNYACELSQPFITAGEKLYPDLTFISGDFLTLALKDKVDLAIIADVLEHIPDSRSFMQKVRLIAKQVIIKMPLEWSIIDNLLMSLVGKKTYPGDQHSEGHLWESTYTSFIRFLRKEGLTILEKKIITPPIALEYPKEEDRKKPLNLLRNGAHRILPASLATILVGGHCVVWGKWKD